MEESQFLPKCFNNQRPRMNGLPANPIELRDSFYQNSSDNYYRWARSAYRFWTPNFTIACMDKVNFFVKRFNFIGSHLIVFGAALRSIEVYSYRSVDQAYDLLEKIETDRDYIENLPRVESEQILNRILVHTYSVYVETEEMFSRDICLFHRDNRHIIVVTKRILNDGYNFYQLYQNAESMSNQLPDYSQMEALKFYLIDYLNGVIQHSITMDCDKLCYSCVDLYNDKFMFFSGVHQTIYLYHIDDTFKFIFIRNIGRFCLEDDEHLNSQAYSSNLLQQRIAPFRESFTTMMKHKFKLFIYKKFLQVSPQRRDWFLEFFRKVHIIESYTITKIQFINEKEFLIKYEAPSYYDHYVIGDFVLGSAMFVFYEWNLGIFKDVQSNTDFMVKFYEDNFMSLMKHHNPHQRICTIGNSVQMRYSYYNFKDLIQSRNLTKFQRNQAIIQALPFKAQSFSASPYLDMELFKYNELFISPFDRVRNVQPFIQFWDQSNNQPLFRLFFYDETNPSNQYFRENRAIEFIIHPTEPFIISVYRSHNETTMFNLHLHRPNTKRNQHGNNQNLKLVNLVDYFSQRPPNFL